MNISEYIVLAWRSLSSNKLRAFLTVGIIALGITALVGILTAVDGIKGMLTQNFTSLGANTFTIKNLTYSFKKRDNDNQKENPIITREQAELFKQKFAILGAKKSYSYGASFASSLKYNDQKTDPNINVKAVDNNYFTIASGFNIEDGRDFNSLEHQNGTPVVILGKNVAQKLFITKKNIVGEFVLLDGKQYKIIGILEARGESAMTNDNVVFITIQNGLNNFYSNEVNYTITVDMPITYNINDAVEEAEAVFRTTRKINPTEEANFEISKSDKLATELYANLDKVRYATLLIGLLTLLGAGIGLMNILLVSVNERTREIGVSKALGATRKSIIYLFLSESLLICQAGGLIGIIVGVLMGNIVSLFIHQPFIIPWIWMSGGIVFCFVIGIASGIYPAFKAGKMNPVEALRYE